MKTYQPESRSVIWISALAAILLSTTEHWIMLPGLSMPVGDCAGLHPDEAATASLHTLSARYRRRGRTARLRLFCA
jgi:hypothetical protein